MGGGCFYEISGFNFSFQLLSYCWFSLHSQHRLSKCIAGVKPTQDDWSETAREKFQELVTEQVFSVWFQDEGEHDMASVILIDSQSGSNAFIHTTLINDGVAARTTAT